jgi:SAM-dependent methyltransferase
VLRFLKALVPRPVRRALRREAARFPERVRDFPRDAVNVVRPVQAFTDARGTPPRNDDRDWLDFGCGCGRLARWIGIEAPEIRLTGVDVDGAQVRWAARHLSGAFSVMQPRPPLAFPDESFDVAYAVSIFTHLDEGEQDDWLGELARVLRPGGLLLATTHAPDLSATCPGLTPGDLDGLGERGFLAVNPGGTFNERSSFHSRAYLESRWGRILSLRRFAAGGFVSYQDLSVWEKRARRP